MMKRLRKEKDLSLLEKGKERKAKERKKKTGDGIKKNKGTGN